MRPIALAVLTACGRIEFDPVPADAAPDAVPFSICEEPRMISMNDGDGQPPAIAANGSGVAVAWHDVRSDGDFTANVALVAADGTVQRVELMREFQPSFFGPFPMGIACTGTRCGVAWQMSGTAGSTTYFAVIDADGSVVATPTIIDSFFSAHPAVVWTGAELVVAYAVNENMPPSPSDPSFIKLRRYAPSGQPLGVPTRVTDDIALSQRPALVWTGSSFLVTWRDGRAGSTAYVVAADASGTKLGPDRALGDVLGEVGIAWDTGEAVVAYGGRDTNPGLHLLRLDASAQVLDTVVHAPVDLFNPSVVVRDGEWIVTGRHQVNGGASLRRFDASLAPVGSPVVGWPTVIQTPGVTWTGERLAIAYADEGEYPFETYLTAICP